MQLDIGDVVFLAKEAAEYQHGFELVGEEASTSTV